MPNDALLNAVQDQVGPLGVKIEAHIGESDQFDIKNVKNCALLPNLQEV